MIPCNRGEQGCPEGGQGYPASGASKATLQESEQGEQGYPASGAIKVTLEWRALRTLCMLRESKPGRPAITRSVHSELTR